MTSTHAQSLPAPRMLVIVAAAWLLCPVGARAQLGWGGIDTLSGIVTGVGATRLAVETDGGVAIVWTEPAGAGRVVKAIHRAREGAWTMASPLGIVSADTDVAVAETAALVIWTGRDGAVSAWRRSIDGAWNPETVVAPRPGVVARAPAVAVDGAGNAVAVWHLDGRERIEASRYDAAGHTWQAVTDLGPGVRPALDTDDAGNAIASWADRSTTPAAIVAARFAPSTGLWTTPVVLDRNAVVIGLDIDVAPDGTAAVLWFDEDLPRTQTALSVALYTPTTGAWSAPTVLSATSPTGAVAVGAGLAMAVWTTGQGAMFSRADVGAGAVVWTTPAPIAPSLPAPSGLSFSVGADAFGDAVATWTIGGSGYASHYSRTTSVWAAARRLSPAGISAREPQVVMRATGDATVAWTAEVWPYGAVQTTRWDATVAPPTLLAVTPSAGALSLSFVPPSATLPEFAPRNIEYSVDGGGTWIPRSPAALGPTLVISGLVDSVPYALRLRTTNAAGPGPGSPSVVASPGSGPVVPQGLAVSDLDAGVVTLTWEPPPFGAAPQAYRVEGGLLPGQTLAVVETSGAAAIVRVSLAPGVYFVRVRALVLGTPSDPSSEVRVTVGAPVPPSAPGHLLGLVNGATLALSWTNTFDGGTPEGLSLIVDGPVSGVLPLGLVETFRYDAVPPGTYTFRVVAANAAGVSAPSSPLTLTFPAGCSGPPQPPLRLRATAVGTTITLRWSAPEAGAAVTAYRVIVGTPGDRVGSGPAEMPAYSFVVPVAGRQLTGTVPRDYYTLFVQAVNDCGGGAAAGPLTVDVR